MSANTDTLTIALPSKGALSKGAKELARDFGFTNATGDREYVIASSDGPYRFLLARAKDIPGYVESGVADLGITGGDLVEESNAKVEKLLDLPFGSCRLVFAAPQSTPTRPARVATAFPNLAKKFLERRGFDSDVITLNGAIEASVKAGLADAIIDLSETGRTLKANGLTEREVVFKSCAVLIANPQSAKNKKDAVGKVLAGIDGALILYRGNVSDLTPKEWARIVKRQNTLDEGVALRARDIFDAVAQNGDAAVLSYTKQFDKAELTPATLKVTPGEIKDAYAKIDSRVLDALKTAAANITAYAKREVLPGWEDEYGDSRLSKKIVPIDAVGVYAPGGTAAYPSSVLMGCLPAKAAGVPRIALCTPCNAQGECNPSVLVAADLAGVDEIYKAGGAQAIAALALGTATIPKVDKIVGPGNAYVAAAKLEAAYRGLVSIDSPAGPSEVLVYADANARADWVAGELLAQAEHDPDAAVVLVTTDASLVPKVEVELKRQLPLLPRRGIIREALAANGALLVAKDETEAIAFVNAYAPEHLSLQLKRPERALDEIRNAGAIFVGGYSPVASGDYAAGPNHVLPTSVTAKSYSGLSARAFVKEINVIQLSKAGLDALANTITTLAEAEGLQAHANSIRLRFPIDSIAQTEKTHSDNS